MMHTLLRYLSILFFSGLLSSFALAQGDTVTVPDVTGLSIPRAAAELNRAGLVFGGEISVRAAGAPENVVSGQSVAPGQQVARGSSVSVEVPRTPNIRLLYDDNDLTLINLTAQNIEFGDLTFNSVTGQQASFSASRWAGRVRGNQCTQIWSVSRNGPKGLPECTFIQNWLTTNNRANHFWTAVSGVQTFNVVQGGQERAVCNAAPPNSENRPVTCEFYLPAGAQNELAPFIYLAYTTDKLVVINRTENQWMQVAATTIHSQLSTPGPIGNRFAFNAALFGRPEIVARINRLAPNQCLLFTNRNIENDDLPQDCDVIATLPLGPQQLWWTANFEVEGTDGKRRVCNAAVADKLTLCLMPR